MKQPVEKELNALVPLPLTHATSLAGLPIFSHIIQLDAEYRELVQQW